MSTPQTAPGGLVSIGQAARQLCRSPLTLRRIERAGLIPPPVRDRAGRRFYSTEDIARARGVLFGAQAPPGETTC